MIDETPLVNSVTLMSDDDIPVVVCYRCGLVAGPDWDEVILGADGRFVCHQRFPEEPKHLQDKDLRVHYFAKKSLSWYTPNIRP